VRRQIWSIGGGKGGIGKSLLAASLGWQLARLGKRVVLVDADLGGANLHTCLGLPGPSRGLGDFILRRVERIEDVVVDTPFPRLRLISGPDVLGRPTSTTSRSCASSTSSAPWTWTSSPSTWAGTSHNIIDFFLISDVSLLAVVPEPTSIENGYRFIKSASSRRQRRPNPCARS
jgi:flagellar biosynthesis protein FlhG